MKNQLMSFEEAVANYVLENPCYPEEAYYFIRDGFEYAQRRIEEKESQGTPSAGRNASMRQLSGRELSEGLKDFALDEYGPMAFFTLAQWNIHETSDFGELVYNLIAMGIFSQNKGDRKEDFNGVYDFDEALNGPFRA